jgi:hypothetical protein
MTSIVLTIFGLILDIIGVIGLFVSVSKGLTKIQNIHSPMFNMGFYGFNVSSPEQKAIIDLKNNINEIIDATNRRNDEIHLKSRKWLYLIVFGFVLQIVGLVISLYYFLV